MCTTTTRASTKKCTNGSLRRLPHNNNPIILLNNSRSQKQPRSLTLLRSSEATPLRDVDGSRGEQTRNTLGHTSGYHISCDNALKTRSAPIAGQGLVEDPHAVQVHDGDCDP